MKKVCAFCGKKFESKAWFARTCSDYCRVALSRKERKQEEKDRVPKPKPQR